MYLFVDTLSTPCSLLLFQENRDIIGHFTWDGKQQEFDTLIEMIDDFLEKYTLPYSSLSGIVTIIGPGGFTGTRVTTLVVNTIAYAHHISLFALTVSDFLFLQKAPLPWIAPVTKKEVLLWEKEDTFVITEKIQLKVKNYSSMAQLDMPPGITVTLSLDYQAVIRKISLSKPKKQLRPLYSRDPNITIKK